MEGKIYLVAYCNEKADTTDTLITIMETRKKDDRLINTCFCFINC